MAGEMFEREFRNLQELVEQAYIAIGRIGPSKIRLMNKPVKEGLAAFVENAEPIVAELTVRRNAEAQKAQDVAMGVDEAHERQRYIAGTDEGEPAYMDGDGVSDGGYDARVFAAAQAPEPAMCPQTKGGIPCSRELHNVGLHVPDGYPESASWTDKESD